MDEADNNAIRDGGQQGYPPLLASPAEPRGTALWLLIVVLLLVIAPLIALSQIIAYWRTDVVDDQMFGYYGWRIAQGATVYLDVWDNKPPGIYWINALGMLVGHGSYYGVIAMCVLAMVVAHAAFFVVAASVYQRGAAALGTILLACWLMHAYYTGGTNRTETFLVPCELVGVAFYVRGWRHDRWWRWYAAGLLCGLAFLFKQVGLAAWGAMGLHTIVMVLTRQLGLGAGVRRCVLLLLGAATTAGLAAGYLASQGALGEALYATFTFNRAYFSVGASQFPYSLVGFLLLRNHIYPTLLLPLLMALAAVIHSFLWWRRPQYRPADIAARLRAHPAGCPGAVLLFATWFVASLYGALLSPHAFRHYVVPTIPPLMLLATYLINVLRAESSLLVRIQQRAWVLVAFVLMGYFAAGAARFQFEEVSKVWTARIDPWLAEHGWYGPGATGARPYEPAAWEYVGDVVAGLTGPRDKIQCLGYMPGVYLRAKRINVCRFTTTEKIGHVQSHAHFIAAELEQKLRADPPVLLIMSGADYYGLYGQAPDRAWPVWTTLPEWVHENYQLIEDIPQFLTVYIFKLKSRIVPGQDPDLDQHLPVLESGVGGGE